MNKKPYANHLHQMGISLCFFIFMPLPLLSQIPVIQQPQPATMSPNAVIGFPSQNNSQRRTNTLSDIQQRNMQMIEQDMREVEQRNKIQQQLTNFASIVRDKDGNIILPDFRNEEGTSYFFSAFDTLHKMLMGEIPISYKFNFRELYKLLIFNEKAA